MWEVLQNAAQHRYEQLTEWFKWVRPVTTVYRVLIVHQALGRILSQPP